jgi:tetratricopeptide (TPR) repeat protein
MRTVKPRVYRSESNVGKLLFIALSIASWGITILAQSLSAAIQSIEFALKDYNTAIELDQNYVKAYLNRGNLYLGTENKTLALSDFRRACALEINKDATRCKR